MLSASRNDPVFEALGLSAQAFKGGNDWMTGAAAMQPAADVRDPFAFASPYASAWPPAAWNMYAEAAAAAASTATSGSAPGGPTNDGSLLLPEVLPVEKPKSTADRVALDAEGVSVASTSPGSHQLWSSPLPWGAVPAWYNSPSSDRHDASAAAGRSSNPSDSLHSDDVTEPPLQLDPTTKNLEQCEKSQVGNSAATAPSVMLSTPPPKSSFRADAPSFVPAEPLASSHGAKLPLSPVATPGRLNLFECLNNVSGSPTAKLPTSPSGTPDRLNLFECLSLCTPQETVSNFIAVRSSMLRMRTAMKATIQEPPVYKLTTLPAVEVEFDRDQSGAADARAGAAEIPIGEAQNGAAVSVEAESSPKRADAPPSPTRENAPSGHESGSRRQRGNRNKGSGNAAAAVSSGRQQASADVGGKGGGKVASRSAIRANAAAARAAAANA